MSFSQEDMEDKTYEERRIKDRREADRHRKQKILHCAKRIVQTEALFNSLVDDLLDTLSVTREELNDREGD